MLSSGHDNGRENTDAGSIADGRLSGMNRMITWYMLSGSLLLAAMGAFAKYQGAVPQAFVLASAVMVASCALGLVALAVRRSMHGDAGRAILLLSLTCTAFMVAPVAGAWAI